MFTTDDMAIRGARELALVLVPPWALPLLLLGLAPFAWLLDRLVGRNVALHDPRAMQRWNMNVNVPLWDVVRRTRLRDDVTR